MLSIPGQLLLLLGLLVAESSESAIYRCEVDGVATFTQIPCANDAQEVIVDTGRSSRFDPGAVKRRHEAALEFVERGETARALRVTSREVRYHKAEIKRLQRKMKLAIKALKLRKKRLIDDSNARKRKARYAREINSVRSDYLAKIRQSRLALKKAKTRQTKILKKH